MGIYKSTQNSDTGFNWKYTTLGWTNGRKGEEERKDRKRRKSRKRRRKKNTTMVLKLQLKNDT